MVEDNESAHALNRYRGFFLPARNALLWMTFMQLSKVFDRDDRTVSLSVLLHAAKANRTVLTPQATKDDLSNMEKQIDDNEQLLNRLNNLRDQRIAHHDAIASSDRRVLFGEVKTLVEDIQSMYNSLSGWHRNEETMFEVIAEDVEMDTSRLVQVMREENMRNERDIALRKDEALKQVRKTDTP
jgi:hypothetical protein